MSNEKLLPCPFCNTRAEIVHASHIRCANIYNCDCHTRLGGKAWNRRAALAAQSVGAAPPPETVSVLPEYADLHIKQHTFCGNENGSEEFVTRPDYDALRELALKLLRERDEARAAAERYQMLYKAQEGIADRAENRIEQYLEKAEKAEAALAERDAEIAKLQSRLDAAGKELPHRTGYFYSKGSEKVIDYKHYDALRTAAVSQLVERDAEIARLRGLHSAVKTLVEDFHNPCFGSSIHNKIPQDIGNAVIAYFAEARKGGE